MRTSGSGRKRALVLVGLALLSVLLVFPSVDNGFSLDDYNWLARAEFREPGVSFVLQPEPGQVLSPVGRGAFLLLYRVAGSDPLGYRLAVLALHALNVLLLCLVVHWVAGRFDAALLAGLLFAAVTSYHEAVFWIAAFFHPLSATLCLLSLLFLVSYLGKGGVWRLAVASAAYGAALLTKAPAFSFLLVLAAVPSPEGGPVVRSRLRHLAPFAVLWLLAVSLNLATGIGGSYLLERGYYRPGPHLLSHAAHYLAWMLLPFDAAAERVGLATLYAGSFATLRWLAPAGLLGAAIAAGAGVRFFLLFAAAGLVPFLPFVFAPASRYTYLPVAGLAAAVAAGSIGPLRRWLAGGSSRRVLAGLALAALAVLSFADHQVRDNHYEYRERQMNQWVEDVVAVLPELPKPPVVAIAGFPRLGVDRGIHLQAALRLAYGEPALRLELRDPSPPGGDEEVLVFQDGRIQPTP